ncbi:MAG: transcription termination factor NusA, partial [Fimbriimonadales bacterium]|nr:transcription termination factor NusA [Fimbriimonadales bacterium]
MHCEEIIGALRQLERERHIPFDELMAILEEAFAKAYRNQMHLPSSARVQAKFNPGYPHCFRVFAEKEVVGLVTDEYTQISLEEAKQLKHDAEVGEVIEVEMPVEEFGRIAVQNALQVLVQRLRELEREHTVKELSEGRKKVIPARVERFAGPVVLLSYGRLEVRLPERHQSPRDVYEIGEIIKVYVLEVKLPETEPGREPRLRDVRVIASRTRPELVACLLKQEVPEIASGDVEIKAIAREPGERTKVAVASRNPLIDAVGACLGSRGMRIQAISNELFNEPIDVIKWSSDPEQFIREALSPARVNRVILHPDPDPEKRTALVVVPNHQMRQAVGKGGVNVRLAEELTGWKLDV